MADAEFESFFGAGGSGGGVFPVIPVKRYVENAGKGFFVDGFAANGDYISFPTVATTSGVISYYNNAGTLVWTKTVTTAAGSAGLWIGFHMTAAGVLYALAHITTGTLLRLMTIDAAGTVTLIGAGFSPSPALITGGTAGDVFAVDEDSGITSISISGTNAELSLEGRQIVISTTTGALVSQDSAPAWKGSAKVGPYYFGVFSPSVTQSPRGVLSGKVGSFFKRAEVAVPETNIMAGLGAGVRSTTARMYSQGPIHWRGELVYFGIPTRGVVVFDPSDVQTALTTLSSNINFGV